MNNLRLSADRCLFQESFDSDSDSDALSMLLFKSTEEKLETFTPTLLNLSLTRPALSLHLSFASSEPSRQSSFLKLIKPNAASLPSYNPPDKTMVEAMKQMCRLYHVPEQPPAPPQMPLAKTNTAMCNYLHRLYVYRSFLDSMILQRKNTIRRVQNARMMALQSSFLHQ